eukprot:TRINITY_DN10392_c0_g1_i1.p1 TRINITY_DN10392_c0_g1~~TRINITY_DN10392_c0_g1_i1.p1  ORF type:complete len:537 (+),score=38.56 TRINITY_DN10392_c0_g1_i1:7-1617(+)
MVATNRHDTVKPRKEMKSTLDHAAFEVARAAVDPAPHIPAAGKQTTHADLTTGHCLTFGEPDTPTHIKPWRKRGGAVGASVVHPGKIFDPPPPDLRFGRSTATSETAATTLASAPRSAFAQKLEDAKEAHYYSKRKEPLGRGPAPSARVAELQNQEDFKFGIKTTQQTAPTIMKQTLCPIDLEDEEEEVENDPDYIARQTHFNNCVQAQIHRHPDVAERSTRCYAWGDIDPGTHRFGSKPKTRHTTMNDILQPEKAAARKTVVVKKVLEDHKDATKHDLGAVLSMGFGDRAASRDPTHVYGKPSTGFHRGWGSTAAECMRREEEDPAAPADDDLGRPRWYRKGPHNRKQCQTREEAAAVGCFGKDVVDDNEDLKLAFVRPQDCQAGSGLHAVRRGGYRAQTAPNSAIRPAGVPTVRTDVRKPAQRRVTNAVNYGDEQPADALVRPYGGDQDIDKDEFEVPITQAMLYELLDDAHIEFGEEEKIKIWNVAVQLGEGIIRGNNDIGLAENPDYAQQYPNVEQKATLTDFLAAADMLGL